MYNDYLLCCYYNNELYKSQYMNFYYNLHYIQINNLNNKIHFIKLLEKIIKQFLNMNVNIKSLIDEYNDELYILKNNARKFNLNHLNASYIHQL